MSNFNPVTIPTNILPSAKSVHDTVKAFTTWAQDSGSGIDSEYIETMNYTATEYAKNNQLLEKASEQITVSPEEIKEINASRGAKYGETLSKGFLIT